MTLLDYLSEVPQRSLGKNVRELFRGANRRLLDAHIGTPGALAVTPAAILDHREADAAVNRLEALGYR